MAGVTAQWHLERKLPIHMVNQTGSLTLLFRLERREDLHGSTETKPDSPVDAPEELRVPCRPWRGNLRFLPHLQMRTSAPAATGVESQGAPRDSQGDWTSLKAHERVPEVPVGTRE